MRCHFISVELTVALCASFLATVQIFPHISFGVLIPQFGFNKKSTLTLSREVKMDNEFRQSRSLSLFLNVEVIGLN